MLRRILIGLVILVLMGGMFGAADCGPPVTEEMPPVSETPTPDTSTPDEEDVDETLGEQTAAISTSTFTKNVINDKYKQGDVVLVSGTVKEIKNWTYGKILEFEPTYKEYTVRWEFHMYYFGDDPEKVENLQNGQSVIISGRFQTWNDYTKTIDLDTCFLVKEVLSINTFARKTINEEYVRNDLVVVSGIVETLSRGVLGRSDFLEFLSDYEGFPVRFHFDPDERHLEHVQIGQTVIIRGILDVVVTEDDISSGWARAPKKIWIGYCSLVKMP